MGCESRLKIAEVKKLKQEGLCSPDVAASKLSGAEALRFGDRRILIIQEDGSGCIWQSLEEYQSYLEEESPAPRHILEGRVLAGESFVSQIPFLVSKIGYLFGIAGEKVDLSSTSLKFLDLAVRNSIGRLYCFHSADYFQSLVAYVGEIIRTREQGKWQMRLGDDGKTWEPWVIGCDGREHSPFFPVIEALCDPGRSPSPLWALVA